MAKAHAPEMEAPLQREGRKVFLPEFQFDPQKKYVFELAVENPRRELPVFDFANKREAPHKKFKPWQNIVLTSQIVWEGERRTIRYYDGCTTLFVDEQPTHKETVDLLIKQSKPRVFVDGKFSCFGDERLLLIYLNICSWNGESPYRTRSANHIFVAVNQDKKATAESTKLDEIEEALQLAREASKSKMMIHASYLGIPTTDWDSGNDLSEKEMRTAYRKEASANPRNFIDTYGNKSIETKYYINKAWEDGLINNKVNKNKATWKNGENIICDISGLKSNEAICQKIYEFSQTEEGEEFGVQLKSVFS